MLQTRTTLFTVVVALFILVTAMGGPEVLDAQSRVEVRPTVTTPQYQSDAARAISAYERLMERYMNLTEANLIGMQVENRDMAHRMMQLEATLARIELKIDRLSLALNAAPTPNPLPSPPGQGTP